MKGYGAGIASSIGEAENLLEGKKSEFKPLDPMRELPLDYPV
jgi:phenylalanine-4-hydroxylase